MQDSSILRGAQSYLKELGVEIRSLIDPAWSRWARFAKRHQSTLLAAALLFVVFHQAYFWTGRHLLDEGALFLDNGLYGFDSPRVVQDMTELGENKRSNVHPLFIVWGKPMGLFYYKVLGLTRHTSAIAVSSSVAALAVVMMLVLLRLFGAGAIEATLFAAIFGAGTTTYFLGAIPETGCFSILSIVWVYMVAALTLRHGMRSKLAWIASGLFTYGNAVTNFLKNGIAFFLAQPWSRGLRGLVGRAACYGFVVIALGLTGTVLVGSSLDMIKDKWVATPADRGEDLTNLPTHMIRTFFLYTMVGPTPQYRYIDIWMDEGPIQMDGPIVMFNDAAYATGPGLVACAWIGMLAMGVGLALARRRPEDLKMLAMAALCLAWDFAFFSRYYVPFEGVFVWSAHYVVSVFFPVVFLAAAVTRLRPTPRFAARIALAVFLLAQAANNFHVMSESVRLLNQ